MLVSLNISNFNCVISLAAANSPLYGTLRNLQRLMRRGLRGASDCVGLGEWVHISQTGTSPQVRLVLITHSYKYEQVTKRPWFGGVVEDHVHVIFTITEGDQTDRGRII